MQKIYKISGLRKLLKEAGVPNSRMTIIRYEKKGIIDRPAAFLQGSSQDDRVYTQEEADIIIQKIKEHKDLLK